jgi:MFS family permease
MSEMSGDVPQADFAAERRNSAPLWRHTDFLRLWTGTSISLVGTAVTGLALPLVAVLALKAGPVQMGFLGALQLLPYLLASLPTGVWVDRIRCRPLLVACDLGRAVLLASIPAAALLGWLSLFQLYAVGFLVGTLNVIFGVAYQAFLPPLVGREHLVEGNTKLGASAAGARVIGQGIGGTLVQMLTAPVAIVLDSLSYLVSAACIILIRTPEPAVRVSTERRSAWREMSEGLRVILRQPILRAITQSWMVYEVTGGVWGAVYLLYLVHNLGIRPATIGGVFAFGAVSGFAGAALSRRAAAVLGLGPSIWIAFLVIFLGGVCLILASVFRSATVPLLLVSNSLSGLGLTSAGLNQTSLRQSVTPAGMQGRVGASFAFSTSGIQPVGLLLGGFLGQTIGIRPTMIAGVIAVLLITIALLVSPIRTVRTLAPA